MWERSGEEIEMEEKGSSGALHERERERERREDRVETTFLIQHMCKNKA